MVLVGSEAVVESGVSSVSAPKGLKLIPQGLVSAVGTYQMGLVAKALSKPFYALAESYKFLRHYPLSQTDIPLPRKAGSKILHPLSFPSSSSNPQPSTQQPTAVSSQSDTDENQADEERKMTKEMMDANPMVDITTPDLIDFIITDLGAPLSPTSVSQYLVAQFSS